VEHALLLGKRIIPIVYRAVDPSLIRADIAKLNWIFCEDGKNDFEESFAHVLDSVLTDPVHIITHTKILLRALEWKDHGQDKSYLCAGKELEEANRWIAEATEHTREPVPTQIQRWYIHYSNEEHKARLKHEHMLQVRISF
jgi:predicted methyltransferase